MRNLKEMSGAEVRKANGGASYQCRHCGYTSGSYWKTYTNALKCVTRKYGYQVYRIVSSIVGR